MGGGQTTIGHDTLGGRAAEDPHKGQLAGTARHGLGVALGGGGGRLDGEVDAVLDNVAGGGGGRLPGEVGTVRRLADLDGGGGAGEPGQARLEGGDLENKKRKGRNKNLQTIIGSNPDLRRQKNPQKRNSKDN